MKEWEAKRSIAARVAQELKKGDVVNLGIGLPTLVPDYLPEGVAVILHSENGIVGTGPKPCGGDVDARYIVNAGGSAASVEEGGCYIDSSLSFALIRGGHVDCAVMGALEVDEEGNLSNWAVPGRLVGMGGAMDLVAGVKKVIVAMEHTAKGKTRILKKCRLPLTGSRCVNLIVTEMGVIEVGRSGLKLVEYDPRYSISEIRAVTEAMLDTSEAQAVPRT